MILDTNFFINFMDSIATKSMDLITGVRVSSSIANQILIIFILIVCIFDLIANSIREPKIKKILDEKIPDIAINYYRNKYQAVLDTYLLELEYSDKTHAYSGSGYVYIDENKKKYIYVNLNSSFELVNINDNIQDDIIIEDIENILSNIKKEYNIACFTKLNKKAYIDNQYSYNNNISEYFTKNKNINISLIIIHNAENNGENFNYNKYCGDFTKDIYSSLKKDFEDIDIDVGVFFVKSEDMYNYILEVINECERSDVIFLTSLIKNADHYLMKNDDYYYYVFNK